MVQQVCVIADDGLEHDSVPFEPSLSIPPLGRLPLHFAPRSRWYRSRGDWGPSTISPLPPSSLPSQCTYIVRSGIMGLCHLISGDYFLYAITAIHRSILGLITEQRGNNIRGATIPSSRCDLARLSPSSMG